MSALSRYWLLVGKARGAAQYLPMHKTAPQQRTIGPKCQQYQETSQTTFDTFDQSQRPLHTLHKPVFVLQLHFTFLEIIKHATPKMSHTFFHLQY